MGTAVPRAGYHSYYSLSSVSTLRASIWYCHPSPPTRRNWIPCSGSRGTLRILISNRTTSSLPELISNRSSIVIEPLGPDPGVGVGGPTNANDVGGALLPPAPAVLPVDVPCVFCCSCFCWTAKSRGMGGRNLFRVGETGRGAVESAPACTDCEGERRLGSCS